MTNYFAFFNLPEQFAIDLNLLEVNFRAIQSTSHPDRFVTCTPAEKLQSMQTATLANEAYLTLKNPANRAKYLLQQQGIEAIDEKNTQMPADFLMQQMEWREAMEDAKSAKNIGDLEKLLAEMQLDAKKLQANLANLIDTQKDYKASTDAARKLIFMDKVCADIHKAIEQLE